MAKAKENGAAYYTVKFHEDGRQEVSMSEGILKVPTNQFAKSFEGVRHERQRIHLKAIQAHRRKEREDARRLEAAEATA